MNKIKKIIFFLSLMVLLIFSISNVLGADVYTDGCWVGNMTDDTTYYLTQDIDVSTANSCFYEVNDLNNVVLDCQGYEISQSYNSDNYYGFGGGYDGNYNNITIRNCEFSNWGFGAIHMWNTNNTTIQNNIFHDNGDNSTLFGDIRFGGYNYEINTNLIIENNDFINVSLVTNGVSNLQLEDIDNLIIRNNNFSGTWNGTNLVGVAFIIQGWDYGDNRSNYEIYGNRFENFGTSYNGGEITATIWNVNVSDSFNFLNVSIYDNYFYNILNGLSLSNVKDSNIRNNFLDKYINGIEISNGINVDIYDNNLTNMKYSSSFPASIYFNNVNHSLVYGNNITNISVSSFYGANGGIYIYDSDNIIITDNIIDEYLGIPFYLRNLDTNITIHDNIITNPVVNGTNTAFRIRDSSNVEIYNENYIMDSFASNCLDFYGSSINNYVHEITCSDSNNGVLFRASGTYTGNIIINNTFTNNNFGVQFNDIGDIITLSSNNIYANTVNVQSGNLLNISGNYYVDGDVNSSDGYCLTQPYTEGNVTDYSAYCCLDGFNDGCSYTPTVVDEDYTPTYTDSDIPKATLNVIVKSFILIGTFITFFVIILIINIIKKNKLIKE